MARIVFLNIPAHGHTNPTLPLVASLVSRGHRVAYYSGESFAEKIRSTGASFRSYGDSLPIDPENVDPNMVRLAMDLREVTDVLLPRVVDELRRDPPDLILHDSLCVWGWMAARILGIPSVCSTTTFALSPWVTAKDALFMLAYGGMALAALPRLPRHWRLGRRLSRRFGVGAPGLVASYSNPADRVLVFTSRAFQPVSRRFGDRWRFVGPSIDPGAASLPLPPDLKFGPRLLYISLGTIFNGGIDFYRACFAAFADLPLQVVLSIGRKVEAGKLGAIPPNFKVYPSLPQIALLSHASAFVTHGGMNSAHESLLAGVPMVVVPQAADQGFVAGRVAQVGAGIHLPSRKASPENLRRAVRSVLENPAYRQAARQVGATLREAGGVRSAVDEVEAMLPARD